MPIRPEGAALDVAALLAYCLAMHEMSITDSLLGMVREELARHGAQKLILVRVRYGPLANLVPEAMEMAFEVLTAGTEFEGAKLELAATPLVLGCTACGREFSPEGGSPSPFVPCPACGAELGHSVISGRELYLDHLEAE